MSQILELDEVLKNPIQKVKAESGDVISQPTFITDIDFTDSVIYDDTSDDGTSDDTSDDTGDDTDEPDSYPVSDTLIEVNTDDVNFALNSEFTVKIDVDSGEEALVAYTVKIEFDMTVVEVIDSDADTEGIQIEFLDNRFDVVENEASNTGGTIVLQVESTDAFSVGETVANINFRVIDIGTTSIEIIETESALVDTSSANILDAVDNIQITTGEENSQVTDTIVQEADTPVGDIEDLPKSDLPFSGFIYIIIGIFLIYLGILGRKLANHSKDNMKKIIDK